MSMRLFGIAVCTVARFTLVPALSAQVLDLRGRVVRADGAPIPEATVELAVMGATAKTAADGSFALDGNTSVGRDAAKAYGYRLEPGYLVVDAQRPLTARLEIADGAGRRQGGLVRGLGAGSHRIALSEAMPAQGREAGLYVLRLEFGGDRFTHSFLRTGEGIGGTVFGPAYGRRAAAKPAAAVDSLRIRKAGYRDLVTAVASYTAGNLGDLVLSADPDGGGICARQRKERTSDGYEVVICEALHVQPPRVRLPAAAASHAYAGRTADAFVTVAGEAYPHASSGTADPEIIRHASALYEIRIEGGKVAGFRPAIVFAESLFLAPLMGKTFEGLISRRTDGVRYEGMPSLPIRVRIQDGPYPGPQKTPSAYTARAEIANLAAPVAAADGACLPSLASYGAQAPFGVGEDVLILVGRHPSMHAFGDDELVFHLFREGTSAGSLMSTEWFFTPLDLARNTLAPSGAYTGTGHGTPGYIPMLDLHPASGGGGTCAPR